MDIPHPAEKRWQTPSAKLAQGFGSTHIICLNAIRREAGPRWEKMRESIVTRLEAMFRQRLGPSDFFVPIDDTAYLVVMPSASMEEGQICCIRISFDLHSSLLGACSLDHLDVARAEVVGDDVLEMRPFTRLELVQLAEKADLKLAAPGSGNFEADIVEFYGNRTGDDEFEPDIEISFLPVWDAQYEVIRAYRCIYKRKSFPSAQLSLKEEARELSYITLASLNRVSEVLQKHLHRSERFMINLPVSYGALTSPLARMEFTRACRQLPCELRPYLVFKLDELPVGVPHSRLVEFVTMLVPFCRAVFAKVPVREPSLEAYRVSGIKALGLAAGCGTFAETARAMDRICNEAKRFRLGTFVDDVPDHAILRAALDVGIKWVSSAALVPAVPEPGPLRHLSLDNVLNEVAA